ncbi:unnamed protein product [Eruca vesicaria subsp. sativa]|uniref:Uncharacterized protein n=1 Tax=Eruca vesicaria subsp. sativa TaxID=29727 RepID=A0ABC8L9B0_ERUVS|nr:unnamed protein product [Eruca vesicaria subsp. sativa]
MDVSGKSSANVIYLSSILGHRDGPGPCHKCDYKCENYNVFGNMYRCKLTVAGCSRIPLSSVEEQAVRGVRRKLDDESEASESCFVKRRRRSSPFERSFGVVSPICSPAGDGMEIN